MRVHALDMSLISGVLHFKPVTMITVSKVSIYESFSGPYFSIFRNNSVIIMVTISFHHVINRQIKASSSGEILYVDYFDGFSTPYMEIMKQ